MYMAAIKEILGLSPLARGTPHLQVGNAVNSRFIPAGAGNTLCNVGRQLASAVYPRWRGEHKNYADQQINQNGLSPLARGTRRAVTRARQRIRFIPAGAGNTSRTSAAGARRPVYPRWRGEHGKYVVADDKNNGLSPLARGTRAGHLNQFFCRRFIPAGAGNTLLFRVFMTRYTVYPRWRGEHRLDFGVLFLARGLSPLARGTRKRRRHY